MATHFKALGLRSEVCPPSTLVARFTEPMLARVNLAIRSKFPKVHAFLKQRAHAWRFGANPLVPVPKWVGGQFVWVHPRLLTENTAITQPFLVDWISRYLQPGDVFFDAGAHFGWISLKAARFVGPTGTVVAFEPSPPMAQILEYHMRVNRLRRVSVVQKAVSDSDCSALPFSLVAGGFSYRNSLVISCDVPFLSQSDKTQITVQATTLDTFSQDSRLVPKLIKVDIEGAEFLALRGSTKLLQDHRPIIIVEIHPYWLPKGQSQEQILEFLRGYGYTVLDSHVDRGGGVSVGNYLLG